MTIVETLWQQLETVPGTSLVYRRYPGVRPDIYAGLRNHGLSRERLLAIAFSEPLPVLPAALINLQDIRLEWLSDPLNSNRRLLLIALRNPVLLDLFAVVCEDLIGRIANTTDRNQLVNELFNRLNCWAALFESYTTRGLSAEAQRGLFGELNFLRVLLLSGVSPIRALTCWIGPTGSSHDFKFAQVSVEVKTSIAVNPQSFQVSSAQQLDDTGLTHLFVLFLPLSSMSEQGETLNQLVDDVVGRLEGGKSLLNQFQLRLYEAGYFPDHRPYYDQPSYLVRSENYFRVGEGFPRFKEVDVPFGINEIRYAVSLIACAPFTVSRSDVLQRLGV